MDIALITYPIDTNPAGVGVHVENVVKQILQLDQTNTYHLLHFKKTDHPVYDKREVIYKHFKHLPYMISDSWFLAGNGHRYDIVHRFLPGGFLFPIPSKIVVTVHDLFQYKQYAFNRSVKIPLARYINKASLLKADAVLAVSEFTRQEILKTFPIPGDRVHVAPNAARSLGPDGKDGRRILEKHYGLTEPYLLFVSTIEPRKNLITLIKAFEILKQKYGRKESLVIVGQRGWDYDETVQTMNRSPFRSSIREIGYVPDAHLGCFYRNAALFVYPSLMEGFGLPPLEAMACECPTLASNTASLPEIMEYHDMMFSPTDAEALAAKSYLLLSDESLRKENIQKGKENVWRFSWKRTAEKIIGIYQSLEE